MSAVPWSGGGFDPQQHPQRGTPQRPNPQLQPANFGWVSFDNNGGNNTPSHAGFDGIGGFPTSSHSQWAPPSGIPNMPSSSSSAFDLDDDFSNEPPLLEGR
jgi:hypothetical protein